MADTAPPPPPASRGYLSDLDAPTKRLLAEMMVGEAGGEGPRGMQAVMEVALNRAQQSGQSLDEVLNTRNAFTSMDFRGRGGSRPRLDQMSDADLAAAYNIISNPNPQWNIPENVVNFLNPELQRHMSALDPAEYHGMPEWARGKPALTIGRHAFYTGDYKGGPRMPGQSQSITGNPTVDAALGQMIASSVPNAAQQKALQTDISAEQALIPSELEAINQKAALQEEVGKELMGYIGRNQTIQDRMAAANEKLIDAIPDEYKMRQQELAKVSNEPMDPTRVLGQFLPMLAVLGGGFTRAGVTGSLKAAAAAMNAAKGNDDAAIKRAHDEFHDQLTEVMDKSSLIHQELSDALAASKGNASDLLQASQLIAAKYDIPALQQAVYSGNVKDIYGQNDSLLKTIGMLATLQNRSLQEQLHQQQLDINNLKLIQLQQQADAGQALDDDSLKLLAERAYETGKDPSMGWGSGLRERYLKIAGDVIKEHADPGSSPAEAGREAAAAQTEYHASAQALNRIETLRAQVGQFEGTAKREADLTLQLAGKGTAGSLPVFNRWIQAGRKNVVGDPDVTSFDTALTSFKNEYVRIMSSGGTGTGAMTTDSARAEGESLINDAQTLEMLQSNIATMQKSMGNRMASLDEQVGTLKSELSGQGGGSQPTLSSDEVKETVINARKALRAGADRAAVEQRLRDNGIDPAIALGNN